MDNLSPQGQLRPRGSMLGNNKGFIRIYRDPAADAAAAGAAGGQGDQGAGSGAGTGAGAGAAGDQGKGVAKTGWKTSLSADIQGAPFMSKFEDTPEGLGKAFESYGNLEKLLGHEKVPIPKGPEDTEGWARYRAAMKVPEKPEGYALQDAKLPESLKGMMLDKNKFAAVMHSQHATPQQAASMWKMYQDENIAAYNKHLETLQGNLDKTINLLRQEWGGAYDANVQLGEAAINHLSESPEMTDYLTATLLKDPNGIKFLKKVGDHFAENKIGDFNVKRFAVSPQEAKNELDSMMSDINGPYFNEGKKFSIKEQDAAVKRADDLRQIIHRAKQGQA